MELRDRYRGCLLGLACGDAVGTTVEFSPRGSFRPLTDMVGGGPFGLAPGAWTDDTSMALCLGTSLIEKGGFDARDQMERYCRWWRDGYLSSTDRCFDIGNTVRNALGRFMRTGEPFSGSTDPQSAGNGSLMRLAPVVLFYGADAEVAARYAAESSRTTHGAEEAVDACRLFSAMLVRALDGGGPEEILFSDFADSGAPLSPTIDALARGSWREKTREQVQGTGYVVHSLEAALWCFQTTESFAAAVLCAANLGDDADTTAAICGQIAGAFYGVDGIPQKWRDRLARRSEIEEMADALCEARSVPS